TTALYASFLVAASVCARIGDAQLGAHQIALELFFFLALVLDAVAIAGQVIVGRMLGAGDADGAYAAAVRMIGWSVALGGLFAVVLLPLAHVVPRAFSDDHAVLHQAVLLWPLFALIQPLGGAVFALDGILIGAGDTRCLMWSMLAASAVFIALAALAYESGWGIVGVWAALDVLIGARLALLAARFAGRRWAVIGWGEDRSMHGLAELHRHLGGSVSSDILWTLAHEQGIALPVKDYWDFERLVTVSDPRGVPDLNALDQIYHWTELIQSSPLAVEVSVHAAIGGAYRSQGITMLELRFNPMKRNRGGERDLDHIILAAIRGLDRARLEYPQVGAGLILMMDRTFTEHQNAIIVEKALHWAPRGIAGIDIAGPRPGGSRFDYVTVAPMVEEARAGGL